MPRRIRTTLIAMVVVYVLLVLSAIPATVWRGILVDEPCDAQVRKGDSAHYGSTALWRWIPPHWQCRSGATTTWLFPWGGSR